MNLKQLLGLQKKQEPSKLFGKILGHDNIKRLFALSIDAQRPVAILLHGPPGTAKTQFLKSIKDRFPYISEYITGNRTTQAGLADLLFSKKKSLRYLLLDEVEYMSKKDQAILLNLLETGIVREVLKSGKREGQFNIWVFATCNNIKKLSEPLQTRFLVKFVPKYDYQEFESITIGRLMQEFKDMKSDFAAAIANAVWNKKQEESNVRDCVRVALMARTIDEIEFMVEEL